MALLLPFGGKTPRVAEDAFLAPTAVLVGNVLVEARASVWFGAVLRGDDPEHIIHIGSEANVQDGAILHVGDWGPTIIEARATIGHGAILECCRIGTGSVVGMGAVVLQNAVVGRECLIAAGTVVLEGDIIPDRSVVAGVPGRVRKQLEGSAEAFVERSWKHYVELSRRYLEAGIGVP
ncbi:MAG: gamma carbonic anhydrase family protein [Gemmatimonadetes bacterium]|nr:gamma carbonic anhydrase family protein [Gemmatimonadota bacterium]